MTPDQDTGRSGTGTMTWPDEMFPVAPDAVESGARLPQLVPRDVPVARTGNWDDFVARTGSKLEPSHLLALGIAAATVAWFATGAIMGSGNAGAPPLPPAMPVVAGDGPLFRVSVQTFDSAPREARLVVRGRTEADARVTVKAQTAGIVEAVYFAKGSRVGKGDMLCSLAPGAREAALAESNAALARAKLDHDASSRLAEGNVATSLELARSKAALDAAAAAVKKSELELERTNIAAPFSGIVEEQPAKLGDFVGVGAPCAVLVAADPMLVVGAVSERQVGRLEPGMTGTAKLVTGEEVRGKLRFVASTADPSTRTFRIELAVPNPQGRLRDGVTATMSIVLKGEPAHVLPHSALTLNDAGQIGVRAIEKGDTVRFMPVELLGDDDKWAWVAGLPKQVTLIMAGHEFVSDGQRVEPVAQQRTAQTK